MNTVYVPYSGKRPSTVTVNGHKVLILSGEKEDIEEYLEDLGGTRIRTIEVDYMPDSDKMKVLLEGIAKTSKAHVVLAPDGIHIPAILKQLEVDLPWIQ
jgi:hypothetical protein